MRSSLADKALVSIPEDVMWMDIELSMGDGLLVRPRHGLLQ